MAAALTNDELRLLHAFDGQFTTLASLSRGSDASFNAVSDRLEVLLAQGLAVKVSPELALGFSVNGYQLTPAGEQFRAACASA